MTKDDLLEIVAILTAKNMALEEKIEKMKESHEFQLRARQQKIDLYKRMWNRNLSEEYEENDE